MELNCISIIMIHTSLYFAKEYIMGGNPTQSVYYPKFCGGMPDVQAI